MRDLDSLPFADVVKTLAAGESISRKFAEGLSTMYSLPSLDGLLAGLHLAANQMQATYESILGLCELHKDYCAAQRQSSDYRLDDLRAKVDTLLINCFVMSVSAYEVYAKRATRTQEVQARTHRIKFAVLLDHCKQEGYLSEDDRKGFRLILTLRNSILHSNGVMDRTETFDAGWCIFSFKKGEAVRARSPLIYAQLVQWTAGKYVSLCLGLLEGKVGPTEEISKLIVSLGKPYDKLGTTAK